MFLLCFLGCPVLHNCNPVVFSLLCGKAESLMFIEKQEFLERQEFIAQSVVTMVYYEDTSRLTWNTSIYYKILELIYSILTLWYPDDMCSWSDTRCGKTYLNIPRKARLVYQSTATAASGAVLKSKAIIWQYSFLVLMWVGLIGSLLTWST